MRELRHAREGGTALEVDEHEVELVGRVGQRQREHESAQNLGLTRSGRAHEQTVRAHTALSRLLDIQHHRSAFGRDRERNSQPVPPRPASPITVRVEVAHVPELEEVEKICRALRIRGADRGTADRGLPRDAESRGQVPHHRLSSRDVHGVGHGEGRILPGPHDLHRRGVSQGRGRVQQQTQRRQRGQRPPSLGQVDHGDTIEATAGCDGGPGRHPPAIDYHDDRRHGSIGGIGGEGPTILKALRKQPRHLLPRQTDHARRAGIILGRIRPGVGRPLEPFPLLQSLPGGHHGHTQTARRRHGHQVHQQRPCERASRFGLSNNLHTGVVPQRGSQRQPVNIAVSGHEARHGGQAHGIGLGQGVEFLRYQINAQGLSGAAQPDEHLIVPGASLPHAAPVFDEVGQGFRLGQNVHRMTPLLARHRPYRVAQLGEVGEVFAPLILDALAMLTNLPVDVDADHRQHRHHHSAAQEKGAVTVRVRHGHEDHDAHRSRQGQHSGQDARGVLRHDRVRRRLDVYRPRWALGGVCGTQLAVGHRAAGNLPIRRRAGPPTARAARILQIPGVIFT